MGTKESDPLSIMCYDLPGAIMKNRKRVVGGKDINPRDYAFAAARYPKDPLKLPAQPAAQALVHAPPVAPVVVPISAQLDDEDRDTFHIVVLNEFRPDVEDKQH